MEVRFWAKVDMTAGLFGCWTWTGFRDRKGYGRLMVDGIPRLAHRVAFELADGPIPAAVPLLHECDNPPCVRRDHLRAGTVAENNADMRAKGRQARGARNGSAKVDEATVAAIRASYAGGHATQADLAARHGLAQSTISALVRGINWRHVA